MGISVSCGCGKQLRAKDEMAGKRATCPACGEVLTIPNPPPGVSQAGRTKAPTPQTNPLAAALAEDDDDSPYQVQARPEDTYAAAPSMNPPRIGIPKTDNRVAKKTSRGFFGPEHAGIQHGVLGGLAMMGIAVVWFVVGLYAGWIFFYPPILFLIGVFAFFKGLITGNVRGR